MNLFGYLTESLGDEDARPLALAEVTVGASPEELRQMAGFLMECASEMERMGEAYDHLHLSDRIRSFESSPHFVVVREP